MDDVLYTAFVTKGRDAWRKMPQPYETNNGHSCGYWPLAQLVQGYLKASGCRDDIIVSPGFMTASRKAVPMFLSNLDALVAGAMSHPNYGRQRIAVGVLRGVNGTWKMRTTVSNTQDCVLQCHCDSYKNPGDDKSYGNIEWLDLYPTEKFNMPPDHRKMLFFVEQGTMNKEVLCKLAAGESVDALKVNAVAIGSSNFSYQTYFNSSFDKGEADVLMFVGGKETCSFAKAIKEALSSNDVQNERFSELNNESEHDDLIELLPKDNMVLSKSILSSPRDPREYLKKLFEGLLADGKPYIEGLNV